MCDNWMQVVILCYRSALLDCTYQRGGGGGEGLQGGLSS